MSSKSPLDLSRLDPMVWRVLSRGETHGPYTRAQIQSYVREGRIGPGTKVSAGTGEPFLPASHIESLTPLFDEIIEKRKSEMSGLANFIVILTSGSEDFDTLRAEVARTLNPLGNFSETVPGTFILRAHSRVHEVRKRVSGVVGHDTPLIVVEAREGRLAWQGLDISMDKRLRGIWNAPLSED